MPEADTAAERVGERRASQQADVPQLDIGATEPEADIAVEPDVVAAAVDTAAAEPAVSREQKPLPRAEQRVAAAADTAVAEPAVFREQKPLPRAEQLAAAVDTAAAEPAVFREQKPLPWAEAEERAAAEEQAAARYLPG